VATEQPTGSNPDLVPTPPSGFPAPVPEPSKPRGTALVAGIVGLAVGAAVVGGAWLLFGNDGASSSPISAPDRLSEFASHGAAEVYDGDRGQELVDRLEEWDGRSSERLSATHDGAGAVVRSYTDGNAESTFLLEAVRAGVPATPFVPYSDPEVLGLERPIEEVREFGAVTCLMRNDPGRSHVVSCQRTSDDLTVAISHVNGDLGGDPEEVAKLVETAWDEIG
jgi:hypothetical protein